MNYKKAYKLIDELNQYTKIDIGIFEIIYDELNIFDENQINKLIQFQQDKKIELTENNHEFIYEFIIYNYQFQDHILLKELLIDEFDEIGLTSYNIIDIDVNNDNTYNLIVEIFNINDDEFIEIIDNIHHQ